MMLDPTKRWGRVCGFNFEQRILSRQNAPSRPAIASDWRVSSAALALSLICGIFCLQDFLSAGFGTANPHPSSVSATRRSVSERERHA
jgi:hypothetical protein